MTATVRVADVTGSTLSITLPVTPHLDASDEGHDPMAIYTPWLTQTPGWDSRWIADRNNSATTPATILIAGDSTSAGQNSSDVMGKNWVELTRARLAKSSVNISADFWPMWTYCAQSNTNFAGTAPFSSPGGSTTYECGYGRGLMLASGQNSTFTTPYGGVVAMDLIYLDYATGSFTYSVDGGGAQTVTTTGASSFTGAKVRKVSITGLAAGSHTLAINGAAGNACIIQGVSTYYGVPGVQIARNAYNGIRLVDFGTAAAANTGAGGLVSMPNDKISLWQGQNPGGASPTTQTGFGFPTQPSLAVIMLGLNDDTYGAAIPAFESTLHRFASALRRGVSNCSLLFVSPSYPNNTNSDVGLSGSGMVYHKYKRVMRDVSDMYGGAYVDLDAKWQSQGLTLGFQGAGDLHPNAAGYADIDATLGPLIAG